MTPSIDNHTGMSAPAPASSLPIGTRMHEYEVKAVIGAGGFGVVYLANDTLLGREVAIKEYLPVSHAIRTAQYQVQARTPEQQWLFDKGLKSFVAEARILAQFRNPNLVQVLRFWEGNGTAYIVMPFYKGKTLRELLQKGFRVTDKASLCDLLMPLLKGLEQVHAVGCFHRDISPDNVIVLPDGSPLLLDFGAARHEILNSADSSTVILKPGFAPIEQYGGKETAKQQGPWTDIYALCAVAYQSITGVMPSPSVARLMRDPLVPLIEQARGSSIPLPMLKAIDAGLQVQPQSRPQSIAEFLTLLYVKESELAAPSDEARVHQQPLVSTATAPSSTQKQGAATFRKKTNFTRIALIGLLIGLMLVALIVWMISSQNTTQNLESSNTTQLQSTIVSPTLHSAGPTASVSEVQQGVAPLEVHGSANAAVTAAAVSDIVIEEQADPQQAAPDTSERMSFGTGQVPEAAQQEVQGNDVLPVEEFIEVQGLPDSTDALSPSTGYVIVQAQPWGDVYLNGELVGTTPPRVRLEVPVGMNAIEVRNDSAPSYKQTLTIQAGKTIRLNHNFAQ